SRWYCCGNFGDELFGNRTWTTRHRRNQSDCRGSLLNRHPRFCNTGDAADLHTWFRGRSHLLITGNSIDESAPLLRCTEIVGLPSAGIRRNVPLSWPAIATRRRCPFLTNTEIGCR